MLLGVVRLLDARQRGNPQAVAEEARRLEVTAAPPQAAQPHLGEDLRALALISLGSAEIWTPRFKEAPGHLEQGVSLARRFGRPFLEFSGLANLAIATIAGPPAGTAGIERPFARIAEHCRQAIELAQRHGWTDEPAAGIAYRTLGVVLAWQGRPEEAEPLIQHSERIVTPEIEPGAAIGVCFARAILELARGRDQDALTAARAVERLAARLATPDLVVPRARALQLLALTRLGDAEHAGQALASLGEQERERGDVRVATAALRLAQDDPQAAAATLAPVLDGSASVFPWEWRAGAFLLEASAQDSLGDQIAAGRALERALDLAEPDGALLWFLMHPVPGLLERHTGYRTAHAALIAQVLSLLARPPASSGMASAPGRRGIGEWNPRLTEPLSSSEVRVLRYLPTNLTAPEIADELSVSRNTVKTHMRNLYAKLGTHRRAEAVTRARDLGLLAPSARNAR